MSDDSSHDDILGDLIERTEFAGLRPKTLFISDAEMYRRIGVSEKIGRVAVRELEKRQIFPPKDPLFGNKRYWRLPPARAALLG